MANRTWKVDIGVLRSPLGEPVDILIMFGYSKVVDWFQ
jgi:hypothetical protein